MQPVYIRLWFLTDWQHRVPQLLPEHSCEWVSPFHRPTPAGILSVNGHFAVSASNVIDDRRTHRNANFFGGVGWIRRGWRGDLFDRIRAEGDGVVRLEFAVTRL
jgi:hypothetical protein